MYAVSVEYIDLGLVIKIVQSVFDGTFGWDLVFLIALQKQKTKKQKKKNNNKKTNKKKKIEHSVAYSHLQVQFLHIFQ